MFWKAFVGFFFSLHISHVSFFNAFLFFLLFLSGSQSWKPWLRYTGLYVQRQNNIINPQYWGVNVFTCQKMETKSSNSATNWQRLNPHPPPPPPPTPGEILPHNTLAHQLVTSIFYLQICWCLSSTCSWFMGSIPYSGSRCMLSVFPLNNDVPGMRFKIKINR